MSGKILKREEYNRNLDLSEQVSQEDTSHVGGLSVGESRVISQEVYAATDKAKEIINEANEEARRIKEQAQSILKRVEEEMEKAKAKGFEEGKNQGLADVTALMSQAVHAKEKMFEGVEKDAVKLVYDIAEKVLGEELATRETAIVDLVRQALQTAMGQKIIVLVNPADLEAVRQEQATLLQALDGSRSLQIRADEKVKPHGCIIETEVGTIDAQLDTQLSAIRKALGLEV